METLRRWQGFFVFSGQGVCVYGWVCCLGEVCVHGWVSCYGQKYCLDASQAGLPGSANETQDIPLNVGFRQYDGQSPYVSLFMINFIWNLSLIVRSLCLTWLLSL